VFRLHDNQQGSGDFSWFKIRVACSLCNMAAVLTLPVSLACDVEIWNERRHKYHKATLFLSFDVFGRGCTAVRWHATNWSWKWFSGWHINAWCGGDGTVLAVLPAGPAEQPAMRIFILRWPFAPGAAPCATAAAVAEVSVLSDSGAALWIRSRHVLCYLADTRKRRVSPPQVPPGRLVPGWHKVRRGVCGEKHPTETAGNAEVASPLAAAAVTAAATAAAPAPAPALIPTPPGLTTVSDCSHLADTRAGSTSARTEQQDEADWRIAHDLLETLSNHADNENSAAQELLNIIFSCKDSRAIKSKQEVLDLVAEPIRRREAYIHKLAVIRGVLQPAPGQYTMQQWKWWLSSRPLDKEDMEGAVDEWKKDFENAEFRQTEQVAKWRREGTRESKKKASHLINGAWKAELSERYGRFQLAIAFMKHPTATIDTLLQSWSMYMSSPKYRRQREGMRH
jgi:hypothetical protein